MCSLKNNWGAAEESDQKRSLNLSHQDFCPQLPRSSREGLWLSPRSSTGDPTLLSLSGSLGFQSPAQYTNKQTSCSARAKVKCCTGSSSTPATGLLSSASSYGCEAKQLTVSPALPCCFLGQTQSQIERYTAYPHGAPSQQYLFLAPRSTLTLTYLHAATPPMPLLMSKLSEC